MNRVRRNFLSVELLPPVMGSVYGYEDGIHYSFTEGYSADGHSVRHDLLEDYSVCDSGVSSSGIYVPAQCGVNALYGVRCVDLTNGDEAEDQGNSNSMICP